MYCQFIHNMSVIRSKVGEGYRGGFSVHITHAIQCIVGVGSLHLRGCHPAVAPVPFKLSFHFSMLSELMMNSAKKKVKLLLGAPVPELHWIDNSCRDGLR